MQTLTKEMFVLEFDAGIPPALEISPGEEIGVSIQDWCFGQVNARPETWPRAAQTPRCPVAGHVFVRGAMPGDALAVEILEIKPQSPGMMVVRPGCGPLGSQVQATEVVEVPFDESHAVLPDGRRIPLHPMIGVIGTAPGQGAIPTLHAGDHGGNLDTREIREGVTVLLPVWAEGGLLGIGDVHAAMGDGELSGSGVEVFATVKLRVNLLPKTRIPRPRVITPTQLITLATRENIQEAIQLATQDMAEWLQEEFGFSLRDASLFLGTTGAIRFSHVINKPGPTVKVMVDKRNLDSSPAPKN